MVPIRINTPELNALPAINGNLSAGYIRRLLAAKKFYEIGDLVDLISKKTRPAPRQNPSSAT